MLPSFPTNRRSPSSTRQQQQDFSFHHHYHHHHHHHHHPQEQQQQQQQQQIQIEAALSPASPVVTRPAGSLSASPQLTTSTSTSTGIRTSTSTSTSSPTSTRNSNSTPPSNKNRIKNYKYEYPHRRKRRRRSCLAVPLPIFGLFSLWLLIILFGYSRFYRWQASVRVNQSNDSNKRSRSQDYMYPYNNGHPRDREQLGRWRMFGQNGTVTEVKAETETNAHPAQHQNVQVLSVRVGKNHMDKEDTIEIDVDGDGDVEEDSSESKDERGESEEQAESEDEPMDVIQIIHTRFMQQQPDLIELGLARLLLFKSIFLSSLEQQTSKNFLCVIRTDPNLDPFLKRTMLQVLNNSTLANYVLVATNDNPQMHYPAIVQQLSNNASATVNSIWSGNTTRALEYLTPSPNVGVLETRLDADDGIAKFFVEAIQGEAIEDYFGTEPANTWRIWCAGKHMEWQYDTPWKHHSQGDEDEDAGSLVTLQLLGCITAGLTQAYMLPSENIPFPTSKHQSLYGSVKKCHTRDTPDSNCLSILDLTPAAIRARTPTSAGMLNVVWNGHDDNHNKSSSNNNKSISSTKKTKAVQNKHYVRGASKQEAFQEPMWAITEELFGFSQVTARHVHNYLRNHMLEIATDNLRGQCTEGHSCKNSSQALLQAIVDSSSTATADAAPK